MVIPTSASPPVASNLLRSRSSRSTLSMVALTSLVDWVCFGLQRGHFASSSRILHPVPHQRHSVHRHAAPLNEKTPAAAR